MTTPSFARARKLRGSFWTFLTAATALAVIGCAGGGGGGSSSSNNTTTTATTTTSTTSGDFPVVNLGLVNGQPRPGQIELSYLTGQGRSGLAPGDLSATIGITEFTDSRGNSVPLVLAQPPTVDLTGYQNQIFRVNVEVSSLTDPDSGQRLNSRLFQSYRLALNELRVEDDNGNASPTSFSGLPYSVPTSIRVFPGRYTTQPIFLNDAHFVRNEDSGTYEFDAAQFRQDNGLNLLNRAPSFISDYLAFDITGMGAGDRPQLSNGAAASRVYFSGDNYAISEGGDRGLFNAINRTNFNPGDPFANLIDGRFAPPGQLFPGAGVPTATPGTYSLIQPNPADPFFLSTITSLQGIWRYHYQTISNQGTSVAISFPSSRDDERQDIVFIQQQTGNTPVVQNLYYGEVDFGAGTLSLFPLRNLTTGSTEGQVTGQVTGLFTANGSPTSSASFVRYGTYSGVSLAGFPSSGTFVVYRQ